MDDKTSLERAFELAKSAQCTTVRAIKRQLFDEGYSTHQITEAAVLDQLRAILKRHTVSQSSSSSSEGTA